MEYLIFLIVVFTQKTMKYMTEMKQEYWVCFMDMIYQPLFYYRSVKWECKNPTKVKRMRGIRVDPSHSQGIQLNAFEKLMLDPIFSISLR